MNKGTAPTISYNLKNNIIIEEKKKSPSIPQETQKKALPGERLKYDHSLQDNVYLSWDGTSGHTV